MSLMFRHRLFPGIFRSALSGWTARRTRASKANRRLRADSPWRPCPGAYALLVDIHRNH